MLHTPLSPPPESAACEGHGRCDAVGRGRPESLVTMRLQLRRRAIVDAVLVGLAAVAAGLLPRNPHDGILLGLAALSLGLLLFVIRRSHDLSTLARAARAQQQALATRGISLAQWQAGAPLPAWRQRS